MSERTWKIRDQSPDGSWSGEYAVTLTQYRAKIESAKRAAEQAFDAASRALQTER